MEELAEEIKEDLPIYKEPETFAEVKNFATNFSYGEVQAGGNPPFSLLIKDIKFQEDADDILTILKEFKILNSSNEHDFLKSLDYGMLLIPQIGEYIAIILTNKFRRFDCEIQMGLSDQINPSDLSEYNPRGLTSKLNLSQNKKEHFIFDKDLVSRNEIMATTTSNFIGYTILQYQGVETSFRIIESADLERLHFIHNTLNQSLENMDEETLNDYTDFNFNFHKIYTDLLNELKEKAYKNSSNALLGVVYSLTPFLMEQNLKNNKYQITCTATLANIINDDNNKNEVP